MGMKMLASIPTLLLLAATMGCDGDADIGLDSQQVIDLEPVTCAGPVGTAAVEGSVVDPATGIRYEVGAATTAARLYASNSADLSIDDDVLDVRLAFRCNTHAEGSYDLVGDTQDGVNCPLEVAGQIRGAIEYLPAETGVVIVDDDGNCLAGRFHADFGASGSLTGWFRAPWVPYP
jgi:hypothetical protein